LEWVDGAKSTPCQVKARLTAYEKLAEENAVEKEARLELFIPPGPLAIR
jgi:hypothetical protein